jgi:hypothetical protein
MATKIVVREAGLLKPPLLVSENANCVEIYDDNELVAVMHKVLSDGMWGVTTKQDRDWEEALYQLGYMVGPSGIVVAKGL